MQLLTLKKKKKEKLVWNQDTFIESTLTHKWTKWWRNKSPSIGTNWKNKFMPHLSFLSFSDTLTPGLPNSSGLIHDTSKELESLGQT